jgi:hypothetical protein
VAPGRFAPSAARWHAVAGGGGHSSIGPAAGSLKMLPGLVPDIEASPGLIPACAFRSARRERPVVLPRPCRQVRIVRLLAGRLTACYLPVKGSKQLRPGEGQGRASGTVTERDSGRFAHRACLAARSPASRPCASAAAAVAKVRRPARRGLRLAAGALRGMLRGSNVLASRDPRSGTNRSDRAIR